MYISPSDLNTKKQTPASGTSPKNAIFTSFNHVMLVFPCYEHQILACINKDMSMSSKDAMGR